MNAYRNILRIWIAITSVIGFMFGWVFFSKTSEPVTQTGGAIVNAVEIPAVPTVVSNEQQHRPSILQMFNFNSSSFQSRPMNQPPMRTGGS